MWLLCISAGWCFSCSRVHPGHVTFSHQRLALMASQAYLFHGLDWQSWVLVRYFIQCPSTWDVSDIVLMSGLEFCVFGRRAWSCRIWGARWHHAPHRGCWVYHSGWGWGSGSWGRTYIHCLEFSRGNVSLLPRLFIYWSINISTDSQTFISYFRLSPGSVLLVSLLKLPLTWPWASLVVSVFQGMACLI